MPQMMPIYWMMTLYSSMFIILMMLDMFFYKNEELKMLEKFVLTNKFLYKW